MVSLIVVCAPAVACAKLIERVWFSVFLPVFVEVVVFENVVDREFDGTAVVDFK